MGELNTELDLLHMSAVREMANIGLGHATTALASMTGKRFNMKIPNVEAVAMERVPLMIGNPEDTVVGICMPFEGDARGYTAFILPWESAQKLCQMLIGSCPTRPCEIDELATSVLLEMGNIVSSSFLNALSDMTDLKMHATPPLLSIDIAYTVISSIVAEAEMFDSVALALETELHDSEGLGTKGYFLCVPTYASLNRLFVGLGIGEAA